jgi:hypothetical protein
MQPGFDDPRITGFCRPVAYGLICSFFWLLLIPLELTCPACSKKPQDFPITRDYARSPDGPIVDGTWSPFGKLQIIQSG